jgi:hypothetical protein
VESNSDFRLGAHSFACEEALAERGGIPSTHPKEFSVAMVKRKFFVVNEQIVEKPFCQCCWEI